MPPLLPSRDDHTVAARRCYCDTGGLWLPQFPLGSNLCCTPEFKNGNPHNLPCRQGSSSVVRMEGDSSDGFSTLPLSLDSSINTHTCHFSLLELRLVNRSRFRVGAANHRSPSTPCSLRAARGVVRIVKAFRSQARPDLRPVERHRNCRAWSCACRQHRNRSGHAVVAQIVEENSSGAIFLGHRGQIAGRAIGRHLRYDLMRERFRDRPI